MSLLPQRLRDGYTTFRNGRLAAEQGRYRELAIRGQTPETMVIGCCDSRVSPEVIFHVGPGELFVMRNAGNLVPPYSPDGAYHGVSSALEYAVTMLQVRHIVVLGHARCGGVRAFADDAAGGEFIGKWMSLLAPVAAAIETHGEGLDSYLTRLEQASVPGVAAKPADVPLHSQALRKPHAHPARRLFRCRVGRAVGARRRKPALRAGHAAFFFAAMSLRLIRHSAI